MILVGQQHHRHSLLLLRVLERGGQLIQMSFG